MRTAEVIRPGDLASFLGADSNQVDTLLETLARDRLLRREEVVECTYCRMAVLRSEYREQRCENGEYRCTSCDRPLTDKTIQAVTTYRRGQNWKEPPSLPVDVTQLGDLVTLSQVAPLTGRSKRTLERYLAAEKLPEPDFRGGDGQSHKWYWGRLRPALQELGIRALPDRFPAARIV